MADQKDTKLTAAIRQAKAASVEAPSSFAFVAKGSDDGALVVSKKKVSAPEVEAAKKACGGKTVFRGRCFGEDDNLVFELSKEPPGTLAKQLKSVISQSAGLTLKVVTRAAAGLEDEGTGDDVEESASTAVEAPGGTAEPDLSAVMRRLNNLSGAIKSALAGPNAAQVKALFVQCNGAIQSRDVARASQCLDGLEQYCGGTPGDAAGLSLVKLGKARLEWDGVRAEAVREIQRLKLTMQEEYKDDPEEQAAVGKALGRLDGLITSLNEELGEQLDQVLNAEPEPRRRLLPTAQATLKRFVTFVDSDQLMSVIDGNEYAPDMRVAGPLRAKLQAIAAALG